MSDPTGTVHDMAEPNQQIRVLHDTELFYAHENLTDGEVYILFDPMIEMDAYKAAFAACDIDPRSEVVSSGYDEDLDQEYVILAVVK